jgi:hypothetical protein
VVEELHHAGLQGDLGLGQFVEAFDRAFAHEVGVEPLAEVLAQHHRAAGPGVADHPLQHLHGEVVTHLGGLGGQRLAIDHLGVDEQTVHVEDDSADRAGQDHGAG